MSNLEARSDKVHYRTVTILRTLLACVLLLALPHTAGAQEDERERTYAALHASDIRLGAIAERIMAANLPLCRSTMPLTGIILHSADQYSEPPAAWFAQGNIAISSIIPGSAADKAGLRANDGLLGLNGISFDTVAVVEGEPRRDTIFDVIASSPVQSALVFNYQRGGQTMQAAVPASRGCRSLVEILADNGKTALSSGKVIQISYGMASMLSDQQLAAVFAHELAHSVLEHRRRLEEAGVEGGLFGEFGRNRRLARQVEVEADLLSVHLLANAGYDPAIAPRFWRSDEGAELGRGFFRSRRYPSRNDRAEMMEAEIAQYLARQDGISLAEHLLSGRDRAFAD